jgi:hypothetical protein
LGGKGCSFTALLSENGVTISEFSCSRKSSERAEKKSDEKFTVTANYGEVINLPIGQITINPTLYFNPDYVGKEIRVSKSNK